MDIPTLSLLNIYFRKNIGLIALVFVIFLFSGSTGIPEKSKIHKSVPAVQSTMLQIGEELEYKVSYSFFTIGTIRIQVVDAVTNNGRTIYRTKAFINSNPSLTWLVDLHIQFESEMDPSIYSHGWIGDDSTKKEVTYRRFAFDYNKNRVTMDRGRKISGGVRKTEVLDTTAISGQCQDGLSLFFYARENVRQKKQVSVLTFIDKQEASTLINFQNAIADADIDAVDYPIEVVALDGKADYVGVFGLTGGFRGWFSNDEARIPIIARMNVILGSIKIELMKWNRPGWQPPKYTKGNRP
ncbi:MAG: DUF3108 domain-containing protein [bacterium]